MKFDLGSGKITATRALQRYTGPKTWPSRSTPHTLNSPASGSYIATTHTLTWSGSGFDNYTLLVDTNSSFSSPDSYTQSGTSKQLTFSPGHANYWKVCGNNSCGSGSYTF